MNSKEFSLKIEEFVKQKKCSYLDAVVLYCDENDIDTATVNPLVSKSLKEKIKIEAIEKRLLKESKSGKLPV